MKVFFAFVLDLVIQNRTNITKKFIYLYVLCQNKCVRLETAHHNVSRICYYLLPWRVVDYTTVWQFLHYESVSKSFFFDNVKIYTWKMNSASVVRKNNY